MKCFTQTRFPWLATFRKSAHLLFILLLRNEQLLILFENYKIKQGSSILAEHPVQTSMVLPLQLPFTLANITPLQNHHRCQSLLLHIAITSKAIPWFHDNFRCRMYSLRKYSVNVWAALLQLFWIGSVWKRFICRPAQSGEWRKYHLRKL